jgi:hypothetical protein
MSVENTTAIAGMDATRPQGVDLKSEGDDQLRLLKTVLQHAFAGFLAEVLMLAADTQGATANDYLLTVAPTPTAYTAGMLVMFRATHTNTGAATMKIGGLSVIPLINPDGSNLRAGSVISGAHVMAAYDGTNFRLMAGRNAQMIYDYVDVNVQAVHDYADQLAFNSALPAIATHPNTFLVTDGVIAKWADEAARTFYMVQL